MTRWYRAYVGTCNDPKIGAVASQANVSKCKVIAMWHFILELAADARSGGKIRMDTHIFCGSLDLTPEEVRWIWAAMIDRNMVTDNEVISWKKRQYETDAVDPTNAERQRRWKAKHFGNGTVTEHKRPDTDTDTYTERKKRRGLPVAEPPEFSDFWNSIPHREGSNPRFPALKAYVAAVKRGADPLQINAAAKQWNAETTKIDCFVKTAVAWLNGRYYEEYHAERQRS